MKNKLNKSEEVRLSDVLLSEYKKLDSSINLENINFQKVRGSIRLMLKRVLTPSEIQALKNKVISIDFSK